MLISEKQKQILSFPTSGYEALICDGAVRSGKTAWMGIAFIIWAMKAFSGYSFAFCGKSVGAVERNIVQPLLSIRYLRRNFEMRYNRGRRVLIVRRGNTENYFYLFGGKDESSYMLIQGITLAGVLLDEVALMPRSFVEQALARCSVTGSKLWFNCNPANPRHWFRTEWILQAEAHNALHLHFLLDDNPSLSEEIRQRYRNMYTGVFYKRYILGLWVASEGIIYDMFDEDNLVSDSDIPTGMQNRTVTRRYIAIDYGTSNATAMLDIFDDGEYVWVMREYYYSGRDNQRSMTDAQYADALERLIGEEEKRPSYVILDPSAASFRAELKLRGIHVKAADNDVVDGIRNVSTMFASKRLKIHRRCDNLISELEGYTWDEKALERGEEKPVKVNDHACDALRYFIKTIIRERRLQVAWQKESETL